MCGDSLETLILIAGLFTPTIIATAATIISALGFCSAILLGHFCIFLGGCGLLGTGFIVRIPGFPILTGTVITAILRRECIVTAVQLHRS